MANRLSKGRVRLPNACHSRIPALSNITESMFMQNGKVPLILTYVHIEQYLDRTESKLCLYVANVSHLL